jgi:hypothetical protein
MKGMAAQYPFYSQQGTMQKAVPLDRLYRIS